ncbi:MAG: Ldh family oxidoreductase [Thermomicrobiales bacterium]
MPTHGKTALLSTAPIAARIPGWGEDPFVLDGATTAVAWGKVEIARRNKKRSRGGRRRRPNRHRSVRCPGADAARR